MKSASEIIEFINKQIDSLEIEKGIHGKTERIGARLSAYKEIKTFAEGFSHEQPGDKDKETDWKGLYELVESQSKEWAKTAIKRQGRIETLEEEIERLKGLIEKLVDELNKQHIRPKEELLSQFKLQSDKENNL